MINRRSFIQKSALASGMLALPSVNLLANDGIKKISILHTNDQHSRIEPFEVSSDPQYSNKGGFSRRAALIDKIREQEKHVLLLDAGDVFQGTPYFNFYGGELELRLMSKMGYDLATLGNHEFDNGLEGLKKQLHNAKFDFVNANYDFSNTILEGHFKPYKIFIKNGLKIGVFGLGVDLSNLVPKDAYKETQYLDPIEIAQDITQELKQKKCNFIICLSHIGFQYRDKGIASDINLAEQTEDIDLIIGGHTHTFLDEPVEVQNRANKTVLINQVGWAGLYLGRIDFYFNPATKTKEYAAHNLGIHSNLTLS